MIKLVIFDFDGTLVDSREVIFDAIEEELLKIGLKVSKKFKKNLGKRKLAMELKELKLRNLEEIIQAINKEITKNAGKFKLQKGFNSIKSIDKEKSILSNNVEPSIKAFMKKGKIKIFKEIYGAGKFKDKSTGIKKIMKKHNIKANEVVFVGDMATDIEEAKKAGCFSVAIYNKASWETKKDVLKANPDFIISDLKELKKVLKVLDSL